jgi:hypothetical protein
VGVSKGVTISDVAVEEQIQSVLPTTIEEELVQINQPMTLVNYLQELRAIGDLLVLR